MRNILKIVSKILLIIIALLFIVFGILGFRDHLWHLLVIGIMLLFVTLFWNMFKSSSTKGEVSNWWKKTRIIIVGILIIYTIIDFCLIITGMIVARSDLNYIEEKTMIILGTDVKGDQPGSLLKPRLDTAIKYLQKSPNTKVIATGKGRGEYTEAEVMEKYLINNGIDAERIYKEDKAQSTLENFIFSKEIIKKENLPEKVLTVTNNYHQLRASIYAKDTGIKPDVLSAPTTWYMIFPLSERERFIIATEWMGLSPDLVNKYQEIN